LSVIIFLYSSQSLVVSDTYLNEQVRKLQAEKQDAATQNAKLIETVASLENKIKELENEFSIIQSQNSELMNSQIPSLEAEK
jgi:phage shock protein A